MKKLSDYTGNDAIELWADLLEPLAAIFSDKKIAEVVRSGQSRIAIAREIIKSHSQEAASILLRIDDEPINGLNLVVRLVDLITEIGQNEDIKRFFGFAAQTSGHSGEPMVNTQANEN